MTYTSQQLRCGSDVFGSDGAYIGTVVWLQRGRPPSLDVTACDVENPGASAASASFSGESLGPMPTASVGNEAPHRQTAATAYASGVERPSPAVTHLVTVRLLVALNWAGFRPCVRRIPVSHVQVASLERILLTVPEAALD